MYRFCTHLDSCCLVRDWRCINRSENMARLSNSTSYASMMPLTLKIASQDSTMSTS